MARSTNGSASANRLAAVRAFDEGTNWEHGLSSQKFMEKGADARANHKRNDHEHQAIIADHDGCGLCLASTGVSIARKGHD